MGDRPNPIKTILARRKRLLWRWWGTWSPKEENRGKKESPHEKKHRKILDQEKRKPRDGRKHPLGNFIKTRPKIVINGKQRPTRKNTKSATSPRIHCQEYIRLHSEGGKGCRKKRGRYRKNLCIPKLEKDAGGTESGDENRRRHRGYT